MLGLDAHRAPLGLALTRLHARVQQRVDSHAGSLQRQPEGQITADALAVLGETRQSAHDAVDATRRVHHSRDEVDESGAVATLLALFAQHAEQRAQLLSRRGLHVLVHSLHQPRAQVTASLHAPLGVAVVLRHLLAHLRAVPAATHRLQHRLQRSSPLARHRRVQRLVEEEIHQTRPLRAARQRGHVCRQTRLEVRAHPSGETLGEQQPVVGGGILHRHLEQRQGVVNIGLLFGVGKEICFLKKREKNGVPAKVLNGGRNVLVFGHQERTVDFRHQFWNARFLVLAQQTAHRKKRRFRNHVGRFGVEKDLIGQQRGRDAEPGRGCGSAGDGEGAENRGPRGVEESHTWM